MTTKTDRLWRLKSRSIDSLVRADDQHAAYDTLKDRPAEHFGLIVSATPSDGGEDQTISIRTSQLMYRWGRSEEARRFIERAVLAGLPDTTVQDKAG